jgi:hypothetical protein
MRLLGLVLAAFGAFAVGLRVMRALFRLLFRGVDAFLAGSVEEVRAQRGDLSGMHDARHQAMLARRRRLRAAASLCLWTALLVVPPLTPWPLPMYAAYSLLWLLPSPRARPAT